MSRPRDLRSEADRILGNQPPTQTDREAWTEAGQRIANGARGTFNASRAAGKKLGEAAAIDLAVTKGQPRFQHGMHTFLTIITVGLWAPIYWLHWMLSARRRYQQARKAQLRANGLDC